MKIAALDSSGLVASVAVVADDTLIAEYNVQYKKTHSQTLLPMLAEIARMTELDLATVDAIALAAGPGSFTGLRIGSATAKGLGFALDKPLVEVPTVDGLAYNLYGTDKLVCPLMDARRNQVYTGIYVFEKEAGAGNDEWAIQAAEIEAAGSREAPGGRGSEGSKTDEQKNDTPVTYRMKVLTPQCAVPIEDIAGRLNEMGREVIFLGDGVPVYAGRLKELMQAPYGFAPAHLNRQRAASLAALAMHYLREGKTVTAAAHAPVYLRLSQAEREKAVRMSAPSAEQAGKAPISVETLIEQSGKALFPADNFIRQTGKDQASADTLTKPPEKAAPLTVRPMEQRDVAAISAIEAKTFSMPWKAEDFSAMVAADHARYYVAELAGQPVGACGLQHVVDEGQITNVLVAEEYRRRGIARKLMEYMLAAGDQSGIASYVLEVRAGNQPAVSLYESFGFKTVGRRRDFYEKPTEDALIMEKC